MFAKVCYEVLISYLTALFQTVDRAVDLGIDIAVMDEGLEVVVLDDVRRDEFDLKLYVLRFWKSGIQVHIADVTSTHLDSRCRDCAVEEHLEGFHCGDTSADITIIL